VSRYEDEKVWPRVDAAYEVAETGGSSRLRVLRGSSEGAVRLRTSEKSEVYDADRAASEPNYRRT
jgi:hypothetical protein